MITIYGDKMKLAQGMIGRVLVLRIDEGEDLVESIKKACKEVGIKRGIIKGVGTLSKIHLKIEFKKKEKVTESELKDERLFNIVSLLGIVSEKEDGDLDVHLHLTISDPRGKFIGGHALTGNIVSPSAEIVVFEIQKAVLRRVIKEGIEILEVSE